MEPEDQQLNEPEGPRAFKTLRGFIAGEEPDEEIWFAYSATLRVFGQDVPFDELEARLGVSASFSRRKGDRRKPTSVPCKEDAWFYESPLPESMPLEDHIGFLWSVVRPHVEYLKGLKSTHQVDVFCGYRSNCDLAGFEVSSESLALFLALEIPFGVSVIVG
jgi:hypothetical protein